MSLCEYGCGQEGKYFFKRVNKWCCSKKFQTCIGFKDKQMKNMLQKYGVENIAQRDEVRIKMRKNKNISIEINIDKNILCEYGCGKVAEYIINIKKQKFCCSNNYNSCEAMKNKNKKLSGEANRDSSKRKKHSELMKKDNPMFIHENKQKFINVVTSFEYREKMSFICNNNEFKERIREIRVRNGSLIVSEKINEFRKYHTKVFFYTRKTIRKYIGLINPDNKLIGIKEGLYNVDHIYSIFDGFNNNINPEIIGSYINLQVILWKDNLKKQRKSWMTKEELYERYNAIKDK